ncbi:type II secretion system protein [Myxococcus sp. RHSTA-1-4]|uniref:type IV pilus modification PilV family protein n=1 Tax=Myxococcus sp. RHSTA-1-4 TaxID=2874601 RepID=UPI001CBD9B5B|nr:type II secretion system protein [Myxococcus sp. RHSTA-1-4]MBZ4414919.1 type II secretion system GspH family protein [Myxococcus sp. RHSTA-1-4]
MKPTNAASFRRAAQRGATLIEGMAAAAVLALGISGAFGGLILASQQNADARRLSHASAIATQVRAGIQAQGRARLLAATGPLSATSCTRTDANVLALAGGLETFVGPSTCVVDLDAFEDAAGPELDLVPGYSPEDRDSFRRALVWQHEDTIDTVAVVVSFSSAGQRRFIKQHVALYDPSKNGAGVEL